MPHGRPDPARPTAAAGELRLTFVGHATFLVQIGGLNVLTDPVFSRRASPLPVGPARFRPPGLSLERLPPVHAVLLSHDHYDHLDSASVRRLARRFPDAAWVTPLGYRRWMRRRGVERVEELDWWEGRAVDTPGGPLEVTAVPARHWTRRGLRSNRRLWASFVARVAGSAPILFVGDSGWFDGFGEIGSRLGPFRASILPVGAYEPRWFMAPVHMDPVEAVAAWEALGRRGAFVGSHWGTFRLTDEDPLEPPHRTRSVWAAAGHPEASLLLPGIGETVRVPALGEARARGAAGGG